MSFSSVAGFEDDSADEACMVIDGPLDGIDWDEDIIGGNLSDIDFDEDIYESTPPIRESADWGTHEEEALWDNLANQVSSELLEREVQRGAKRVCLRQTGYGTGRAEPIFEPT